MTTLQEACSVLSKAIEGDTNLEVNFSSDNGISIHWCGVIRFDGTPVQATKAIGLFKQLSALGAKDC